MTTTTASPVQALIVLGIMGYAPYGSETYRRLPPGAHTSACSSFDRLLLLAKKRGFEHKRRFVGIVRKGKATAGAIACAEAVLALVTADELQAEFARASFWDRFGA